MRSLKQILLVAQAGFRGWRRNPRIVLTFLLAFVVSFLLSDKVTQFALKYNTELGFMEPFIWTFGDADSILIISLLLLLLFADAPGLGNETPFYLVRTSRLKWMLGQLLYIAGAVVVFVIYVFLSTCIVAGQRTYFANVWSRTAAVLGYSDIGSEIAVPSFVKVMELASPYECALHIVLLVLGYSVLMSGIIICFNMFKGRAGMIAGVVFSSFGFIMNEQTLMKLFDISPERMVEANILFGWISPLNHATYYMHSFGYDNLPKLWVSYLFFGVGSLVFFTLALIRSKRYNFDFTGTLK